MFYDRNRACEVTAVYVTLDAETGTTTWQSATSAPPDSAVIQQLAVVRDPSSGAVVAQVHGQRAGAAVGASEVYDPCAPDNTPIFPPGTFEPDGNGGFVIENLPRTPTHPMQVDSYVYDHLGRPVQRTFWGDPAYRFDDGHAVPPGAGASPINGRTRQAVGSYPADDAERALVGGIYPRTQTTFRDSFGLPAVEASPAGRATEVVYDDALRVYSTRPRLVNVDLPPGFTGGSPTGTGDIVYLTCTDPPITREYDGILMKALLPGDPTYPCQAAAENLYEPDIRTIADSAFIPDAPDNRVPLGLRTTPPTGGSCGGENATWLIKKNALGELTKAKDPAGNIFDFVRDDGGKLTQLTVAPAGGGTSLVRQFDYDDRGVQVGVSETGGVPGGSSTSRLLDNWGNLTSFVESVTSTGSTDPLRGFEPMMTCYFPQLNTDGWNRFDNGASHFPGGFGERNTPIGPGENGCPNPRPKLGQNWAIEVYQVPGPICEPAGPQPLFLKLGIPYNGIADPSWFEVQPGSMVTLPSINDPKFLSMKVDATDFGGLPTNAWGEPVRDNICAGILRPGTGPCSGDDALEDQSITRDADGRILDLTDNLVPLSGRRTIYMDCSRSLEQLEGRIESPYGPSGGAISLVDPDTIIRRETAAYDRFGNVTGYERTGPSVTPLTAEYSVNAQNQVTSTQIDEESVEPVYDANGNIKEPGDGRRFAYDPFNNLTHVYQTDGESEYLFARFWYNANGRRVAAAYNLDHDPGLTEAVFDDDRVEFFAYDDLWRLRAVYAREAGQANATCRERYAYNPAGMNGKPSSAPLDSPLFGQIDEAGDGTFERSFYLIQNTLGDVIKIVEGAGGTQHEELRYTLYGEPYIVNWMADINQDGAVDGEDLISFFALWDVGAFGSDTNGDGGVDGDDVIQFLAWWDNGEGAGRTTEDNRFGFRGYVWDDHLKLYHVRHRVYDPMPGPAGLRWLQRDPAFFVDGLNLYAYCGGDPVNGVDPLGLEDWQWNHLLPKSIFEDHRGSGRPLYEIEGINVDAEGNQIDDWQSAERGRVMTRADHIGKSGGKITHNEYNDMWEDFLKDPEKRTRDAVLGRLKEITGASRNSPLFKYREWLDKGAKTDMSYKQWGSCTDANKAMKAQYIAMLEEALQKGKLGGKGSRALKFVSRVAKTPAGKVFFVISLVSVTADLANGEPVTEVLLDQVLLGASVDDLREFQKGVERTRDAYTVVGKGNIQAKRNGSTVAPGALPNGSRPLDGE